jgi:hypothetical protein
VRAFAFAPAELDWFVLFSLASSSVAAAATSFSAFASLVDNLGWALEPAARSHTVCGPSAGGAGCDGVSVAAIPPAGDALGPLATTIGLGDGEACSIAAAEGRATADGF